MATSQTDYVLKVLVSKVKEDILKCIVELICVVISDSETFGKVTLKLSTPRSCVDFKLLNIYQLTQYNCS